jgi:hypothetical protein
LLKGWEIRVYQGEDANGRRIRNVIGSAPATHTSALGPLQPKETFAADLFAHGTIDEGGWRAAILMCYEQLLAWPMRRSAPEHPTLLIAISNEAWTTTTVVPRVQQASCVPGQGCSGFHLYHQSIHEVFQCKKLQKTHQS